MMPVYIAVAFYKHVVRCRLELNINVINNHFHHRVEKRFWCCVYRTCVKEYNCYIVKTWPRIDSRSCGFTSEEIDLAGCQGGDSQSEFGLLTLLGLVVCSFCAFAGSYQLKAAFSSAYPCFCVCMIIY